MGSDFSAAINSLIGTRSTNEQVSIINKQTQRYLVYSTRNIIDII